MTDLFSAPVPPSVDVLYGKPADGAHVEQEPCCYETLAMHAGRWRWKSDYESAARNLIISRTNGTRRPDFGSMERHTRNVRETVSAYGWTVLNGHDCPGLVCLCRADKQAEMMVCKPERSPNA